MRRVQTENKYVMTWQLEHGDQINNREYAAIQNGVLVGVRPLVVKPGNGCIYLEAAIPGEATIKTFKGQSLNDQMFVTCVLSLIEIAIACIQSGYSVNHLCWSEDCIFVRTDIGSCSMLYLPVDTVNEMEGNLLERLRSLSDGLKETGVTPSLAGYFGKAVYELQSVGEHDLSQLAKGLREAYQQARQEKAQRQQEEFCQKQEDARRKREEELRQQEEARRREELRQQEEAHRQEELRQQEEAHRQEELRQQEEARRQEELRQQEEARRQEELRQREEARRQEELRQQEESRRREELRQQEEARRQEELRQQEEARRWEELRQQEEARRQEEARQREEELRRLEEERLRLEQEQLRLAEEQRKWKEEQLRLAEERRKLAEAQQKWEEEQRCREESRRQQELQELQEQHQTRQTEIPQRESRTGWLESIQSGMQILLIQPETTIGRKDCSVMISDDTCVSRLHAKIVYRNGEFYIVDLGSRNGTFVGGFRLTEMEEVPLESGTEIRLGRSRFVFYCQ